MKPRTFCSPDCHSGERSEVGISDTQLSFRGNGAQRNDRGNLWFKNVRSINDRLPRQAKAFLAMTSRNNADCHGGQARLAMTGADRDLYRRGLAPALRRYNNRCFLGRGCPAKKFSHRQKKALTFTVCRVKVSPTLIQALTKTVRRRNAQRAGGWCKPAVLSLSTYHFRAGDPKDNTQ